MWFIKFKDGPLSGQNFPIKDGDTIGRSNACNIVLNSDGISKRHVQFSVHKNDLIIVDQKSSNGTFVDGVKINKKKCSKKTHLTLHNINAYIIYADLEDPYWAKPQEESVAFNQSKSDEKTDKINNFKKNAKNIFEKEFLPSLYYFSEKIDMRYLFTIFLTVMVLCTTVVSTIFLGRLMKTSIQKESQRRALSLAKNLTEQNKVYLQKGPHTALSVASALQEPGVEDAFLLSGTTHRIIAPVNRQQEYPGEKVKNIFTVIEKNTDHFEQIDDETIVAISPVQVYDNRSGQFRSLAYSIIVYNMGQLAFQNEEVLSLFVQTLFISLVFGILIFYLLYKILSHIFENLSYQINSVTNSEADMVKNTYQYAPLNRTVQKINELINKISFEQGPQETYQTSYDKLQEIQNICHLTGYPSMIISLDEKKVIYTNNLIPELIGEDPVHKNLNQLNDQSLQLSFQDLINQVSESQQEASSSIEFSGYNYNLNVQTIFEKDKVNYLLAVFIHQEEKYE